MQRRHQGTALQGVWALPEAFAAAQMRGRKTKAKLAIKQDDKRGFYKEASYEKNIIRDFAIDFYFLFECLYL
jgi:hypothetical protein